MNPLFDPFHLGLVALDVAQAGYATADAITQRQRARLTRVLALARRDSRFYLQRLPKARGGTSALQDLPVVTRKELMHSFDDWVTDPRLHLDELRAWTANPQVIGQPYLGQYMIWESSGTSGLPGIFVQDAQALAVYDALQALRRSAPQTLQRWVNPLHLGERIAFVGAIDGHFASYVTLARLRQLNPWLGRNLRCFSILQSTQALVDGLNTFAPTIMATYPTVAELLADQAERGALHLALQEVWTGGENLSPAVRQHVGQALGCGLRDSYGSSEFLNMGWECAHGQLHLNTDWLILEPVDERYQAVPPGVPSYSTLLTHLANTVQPLIRYDLGDQITLGCTTCACGSPLPVIEVAGRCDDALVMAGMCGTPITLAPLALSTVLETEAAVFDFQLRQQDDHTLVLRLAQQDSGTAAAMTRCSRVLKRFAAAQGLKPLRVIEEPGQALIQGRSGKTCRVIARKTKPPRS